MLVINGFALTLACKRVTVHIMSCLDQELQLPPVIERLFRCFFSFFKSMMI